MTKLSEIKSRRPLNEPKIECGIFFRKKKWYINRVVKYLSDGEGVYQYMWKDKSWNTTCGSANMWDSKESCEQFLYGVCSERYHLRSEDFEV